MNTKFNANIPKKIKQIQTKTILEGTKWNCTEVPTEKNYLE